MAQRLFLNERESKKKLRRLAEARIEGREWVKAMTKRRRPDTRSQHETIGEEMPPPKTTTRSVATGEELERRMRSALADVYEVLGCASDERNAVEWSNLGLVNDLIH